MGRTKAGGLEVSQEVLPLCLIQIININTKIEKCTSKLIIFRLIPHCVHSKRHFTVKSLFLLIVMALSW